MSEDAPELTAELGRYRTHRYPWIRTPLFIRSAKALMPNDSPAPAMTRWDRVQRAEGRALTRTAGQYRCSPGSRGW